MGSLLNIGMLLEMAASAGDRPAVVTEGGALSAAELFDLAGAAAVRFRAHPAVLYLGANHLAYPVALFGAAQAGVPFIPLNYRLGEQQLAGLLARHPGALVLHSGDLDGLLGARDPVTGSPVVGSPVVGSPVVGSTVPANDSGQAAELGTDEDDPVAVVLYTSGTTSAPKAALLRHRHLLAYVLNTVEFGSGDGDTALVAVPPYHVAGLANLLTNLYAGRRLVYLAGFDAAGWLATVRRERVTHALLVPTMLARVVAELRGEGAATAATPTLRSLAYGGARMPLPILQEALRLFPDTGFVNAYGLTETTSSIAVLSPDDHREALASADPAVRDRLGSVGRPLPGIEFQIRGENGEPAAPGSPGLIFVRGDQISGEYGGQNISNHGVSNHGVSNHGVSNHGAVDGDGWFATRDRGWLDADGYLFIEGRADDTIIRGGENIAPAEIEDVLLAFPGITEAAVLGVPDPEWGQRLVAVVVGEGDPQEIRQWVRDRLRSSKTPEEIVFRAELPKTETGKLLRRVLQSELDRGAVA
jgi:acyl-CoA synthetase (AMP-forming)/AMP-acid ligase II